MECLKKKLIIFMPSIDGGGVEKNLFIISNFLSKKIDDIMLITFDDRFNNYFNKKITVINYVKNPQKTYSKYFKYYKCILILISEILKKKSLVFAFQANIYCCILSLFLNFDLITRSNSSPSGWTKNFLKNLIFKLLIKVPKIVIVNSKEFKKEIDTKFNINSKLIYNPLNKDEILLKSKEKINFSFFSKNDLKLINIARFTDQKDHLTLLKGINSVKNKLKVKLLIIGYGINKKKIQEYILRNNLKKIVKVINYQVNPFKYLNLADCFVLTSVFEGLPNVILEALCLKKFVISTNCPTGPKEILSNGKYGFLFKIKNYNQLSNLILKYKLNKKLLHKRVIMGYKSLNRFDYKNNCEKYLKVIEQFL